MSERWSEETCSYCKGYPEELAGTKCTCSPEVVARRELRHSQSQGYMVPTRLDASVPSGQVHVCNCIGCCKDCGMCRTSPFHTKAYCRLLVAQKKEREQFIKDNFGS